MARESPTASRPRRVSHRRASPTARLHVVFPLKHAQVVELGVGPLAIGRAVADGLSVDVPSLSRAHLTLEWDEVEGRHQARDVRSRHGTVVDGQPLGEGPVALRHNSVLRLADVLLVYELTSPFRAIEPTPALVGDSAAAHRVRDSVARAAPDLAPVLVQGETGVGKESVANELHRLSGRRGPFLALNCAALQPQLLESQLFGHVKGAFTGADTPGVGLFRAAQGGTLLLDEIGELSAELQPKLLRALQQREVLPVGATTPVRVDVRVVAATNRDLKAEVERGAFRRDLYARLSLWDIFVPPLRERRADTLAWLAVLDRQWRAQRQLTRALELDAEAAESVLLAPLSENLRGLDRLAHELATRPGSHHEVTVADLPAWLVAPTGRPTEPEAAPSPARRAIPSRDELSLALERLGSVRATARYFGRDRRQIYRWIEAWAIEWRDEPESGGPGRGPG